MESFTLKEIIFSLRKEYLQNQKKLFELQQNILQNNKNKIEELRFYFCTRYYKRMTYNQISFLASIYSNPNSFVSSSYFDEGFSENLETRLFKVPEEAKNMIKEIENSEFARKMSIDILGTDSGSTWIDANQISYSRKDSMGRDLSCLIYHKDKDEIELHIEPQEEEKSPKIILSTSLEENVHIESHNNRYIKEMITKNIDSIRAIKIRDSYPSKRQTIYQIVEQEHKILLERKI